MTLKFDLGHVTWPWVS